jgi:hypothetical protein
MDLMRYASHVVRVRCAMQQCRFWVANRASLSVRNSVLALLATASMRGLHRMASPSLYQLLASRSLFADYLF